ncbi:MAG: cell division protein FtsX [Cyclobacteriaceae bacterium]|jgi:cell division transport system permease protein
MIEPQKPKYRKKKLGSYPYVSVVLSISLALFVIGVFGALVIYSKELERTVRDNVKIQVYLKNQLTPEQAKKIEKELQSNSFISKSDLKSVIQFVSKEEAAKQFIKETGEDFKKFLGENPLRDTYLVKIDPTFHDKASLLKIKAEVEKINGVFQVYYVENVIDSINQNVTKIGLVLMGLVALLLLTVVLLINNTVRLALFSQRFIIRSMQLVGAKRWFIQRPFLFQALWHGALAGAIASAFLFAMISFATKRIEDLNLIQNNNRLFLLAGSLLLVGMIVAVASTYRAVAKYLGLSLDELY